MIPASSATGGEISPLAATMRPQERCSSKSFGQDYALRAIKLQWAAPAKMLLHVESDAGVERLRVNVQAEASAVGSVDILNLVDCLELVDRHDATVVRATDRIQAFEFYMTCFCEAVHTYNILVLRSAAS